MTRLEIRDVQVFLALVRAGSFSSAAKELGITQPGVSTHISKLEQIMAFPLFHRSSEGATLTEQGRQLLPHVKCLYAEYENLLRRADYWKRSQSQEVKILADGSVLSQQLKHSQHRSRDTSITEIWRTLDSGCNWMDTLNNFDADIVITGTYLEAAGFPEVRISGKSTEPGLTVVWNPDYYVFGHEDFSFPHLLSASIILPAETLAAGFRDFLCKWCETTYGFRLGEVMEFNTEHEIVEACRLGLGIIIFPGAPQERLHLSAHGLSSRSAFEFLLPKAFTFGVRWRTNEQNPLVATTVQSLVLDLAARNPGNT